MEADFKIQCNYTNMCEYQTYHSWIYKAFMSDTNHYPINNKNMLASYL